VFGDETLAPVGRRGGGAEESREGEGESRKEEGEGQDGGVCGRALGDEALARLWREGGEGPVRARRGGSLSVRGATGCCRPQHGEAPEGLPDVGEGKSLTGIDGPKM
jgi:hypothetical protein